MRTLQILMTLLFVPGTTLLASDEAKVVRILYLQEMGARDALTLLRSEVDVFTSAAVSDQGPLVVSATADRADRCESVLRERGALARSVEPHPAMTDSAGDQKLEDRTFHLDDIDAGAAMTVMRSIYGLREIEMLERDALSVRAPTATLDLVQALLEALGGRPVSKHD